MSSDLSGIASSETLVDRGAAAWPVEPKPSRWRENPERLAWFILLASFVMFVILAVAIPAAIRYGWTYATVSQEARLEPALGTLLLYANPASEPVAITAARDDIQEGNRIVAADDAVQGTLGLVYADGSDQALGSVQLYPGTILDVLRIRRPFFKSSPEPYHVRLRLEHGQARFFTNTSDERPLRVEIETPHGIISLDAGSYQVSVSDQQTDITVRSGQATLTHQSNGSIVVDAGLRAWMTADDFARDPISAQVNLLNNGDFSESMLDTWQSYLKGENVILGSVRIIERDGRRVAHFIRQGEENVPTEVGITQVVEKDVNVYDSLYIQLDVKLLHQSLSGAGYLSSEFPLRVEITYTDIYGKVLTWGHGFYYRDPENAAWRVVDGDKIPPYNWYTYQSPNLMELLKDTRPARINSVRIYASGWNYQSMVSEIYLLVE